ncbi:MAG: hypothetical protein KME30_32305 [Iphinoe sp. HA4291-MV1]|nr:hypothetical protein [Iphinoe sp. HA4291-MV1]
MIFELHVGGHCLLKPGGYDGHNLVGSAQRPSPKGDVGAALVSPDTSVGKPSSSNGSPTPRQIFHK